MPTVDPNALPLTEAMIRTWADHLRAALPSFLTGSSVGDLASNIAEGWEHQGEDLVYPSLSILAPTEGERVGRGPAEVFEEQPADPTDPVLPGLVVTAYVAQALVLDLVCDSKHQRSTLVKALEQSMRPDILNGSSQVCLESSYYHGLSISYRRTGGVQYLDTASRVGSNEWRAVMGLEATAHEVAAVTSPRIIELQVHQRVGQPDPDLLPAATVQTVFDPTTP